MGTPRSQMKQFEGHKQLGVLHITNILANFHAIARLKAVREAISAPIAVSARNVVRGHIVTLQQADVKVIVEVDCGAKFIVHLTPGARQSLELVPGKQVC